MNHFLVLSVIALSFVVLCDAHGMMVEPIGRASRWKNNESAPINYDDDEVYCGGFGVHWDINKGKCGVCGDDFRMDTPRPHEFGGKYGEGVIVKKYKPNEKIPVLIDLHTNHRGEFRWDICNMDAGSETEECFENGKVKLDNGNDVFKLKDHTDGFYNVTLQIPNGLKCKHCVLRWTYKTANSWGFCGGDGEGADGCGPQEHFRSCADIAISG